MWLLLSLSPDTHKQLWYITLLLSLCFSNIVAKSGPSQLWTTHYCFHNTTASDSTDRQLVIHDKNMEAYHQKQKHACLSSTTKKIGKERVSVFTCFSLTWCWSVCLSDGRIPALFLFLHTAKKEKKLWYLRGAVEVTVCPWADGSLTAAFLMQADGSLENNGVLHCGLHPLQHTDNVFDFRCERRRQSVSFSAQCHKAALKTNATLLVQLNWWHSWQCNQPLCAHHRAWSRSNILAVTWGG